MSPEAIARGFGDGARRLTMAALAKHAAVLRRRHDRGEAEALFGLDRRPRPASVRSRILIGLRRSAPFSSLQRRIIFANLIGLAVLVVGALYLNQFRTGLIESRVGALSIEGRNIALTLAEGALAPVAPGPVPATRRPALDVDAAIATLATLARPRHTRARLYDTDAALIADTRRQAFGGGPIVATPLAAPEAPSSSGVFASLEAFYDELLLPPAEEQPGERAEDADYAHALDEALAGRRSSWTRIDAEGDLVVSVALPVERLRSVLGVLVLSTEGGDINEVVRRERAGILQIFVVAAVVSVALSVALANTIASPIRRLARAVDPGRTSAARPIDPERIEVPDMTSRVDEIGDLSAALIRMTDALYKRIEAIESFAADVAHELKNPLTSLRSAVETMDYAKTPEQRKRLLDVILHDVGRMNRLVTDISNASRLDAELVRERMVSFDLGRLLDTLCVSTGLKGEALGVTISLSLSQEPLTVSGLEGRLGQVFANLLDNALSFSPEGTMISVEAEAYEEGVIVTVSDQGPGIPEENLASIFERFYSERPGQAFGNHSGLGLSICKQIVEAHGGRIVARNIRVDGAAPGSAPAGARFIVDLPP
ncbi:MAG: stimulus-sensing domain-containing protein [Paracoccaceae bacterium]